MVKVVRNAGDDLGRRRRIQGEPGVEARLAHRLERIVHVRRRLPVRDDRVRPGRREFLHPPLWPLHHQMHLQDAAPFVHKLSKGVDYQRPHRNRRHEVAPITSTWDHASARVHHLVDLCAEPSEVRRQDRRHDANLLE